MTETYEPAQGDGVSEARLRRYDLPGKNYEGWGIFVIADDGFFSCVTDFGNYAFAWRSFGPCFRSFLCDIETPYLASKLHEGPKVFYAEATRSRVRKLIHELLEEGALTQEQADEERDGLGWDHECEFYEWATNGTTLEDVTECATYGFPGQLVGFCDRLWPRFRERLQAELSLERGHTQRVRS